MSAANPPVYDHTIGFQSNQGRGFNNPVDLAVGPPLGSTLEFPLGSTSNSEVKLYVLNRGGPETPIRLPYKRVTICTAAEEYLGEFGTGGSGNGEFWWPSSLAFDSAGRLYIADEALHGVSIYDGDGVYLDHWGEGGSSDGQLNRPSSIAFDQDDNLYLADSMNHRVQKFTKEGRFLGKWGEPGGGPGQFNMPWGIALAPDGAVYVSDWRNDRIQKFTISGEFLGQFGESGEGEGQLSRPAGLAVDSTGRVYVADWGNERVQIFGPAGDFLSSLRGDSAPSRWAQDYFNANPDEARARAESNLEPDLGVGVATRSERRREESANIEKLFWGPTSVRLDGQGHIYVVDSLRHRVQIYRWPD